MNDRGIDGNDQVQIGDQRGRVGEIVQVGRVIDEFHTRRRRGGLP